MSELDIPVPNSWAVANFGEVAKVDATLVDPKLFPDAPHIAPDNIEKGSGRLLVYRTVREDKMTSNKYHFKAGQILYSKIRPYLAKAVYVDFSGLCSADMYPISTRLYPPFLFRWILSPVFTEFALEGGGRALLPKINREELSRIPVPIPPLLEQQRIVTKIESTFKHIEAIEQATQTAESLLTKYRNSLLSKAFRGELVPQETNDESASKLLERIREDRAKAHTGNKKKDELPPITEDEIPFEIPASWEWVRLGEICAKIGSGQTPKGGEESYLKSGIPLIRSQNVLNEKLDIAQVAFIDRETDQAMSNSRIFENDVLYNITGGSIGRSCVVPVGFPGGNVNQHVLSIRLLNPMEISPSFVSKFLLSPFGKDFIFKNKKGAARDAITKGQIENLIFPLPPSQEINRILNSIARSERRLAELAQSVSIIRKKSNYVQRALLDAAFCGRLVPQFAFEGTGHQFLEEILSIAIKAENPRSKAVKTKRENRL